MINQELIDYIKQQIGQGVSQEKITSGLITNGWQEADINEAFQKINVSQNNIKDEFVIGYVDGVELYGIATLQHYVVIFTNQKIIFLKVDSGWMTFLMGGVGIMSAQIKTEQFIEKLKNIDLNQLISSETDKLIIEKNNLSDIVLSEWPILFRSKIIINYQGKNYKFKLYKSKLKKFKILLNELK